MELHYLLLLTAGCIAATEVEIQTRLGDIVGTTSTVNNTQLNVFRGIPYARPPIGDLRLAKPQPYGSFPNNSLNATQFGSKCAQLLDDQQQGSEDCLFVNVYSPQTPGNKTVMVWIYGGGFTNGASDTLPGSTIAATEDVIVVTLNYRVNIFGFLTTGNERLPGNFGLWDQRLAIKWVKDNIDDYGGNGSAITIFGESAGGVSVGFQIMSPRNNRDLFQRAITESGSSLTLTYINREPMGVTNTIAQNVSCDTSKPDLVKCLRSKTTSELLTAIAAVGQLFAFYPVVDNDFIPYDLGKALANFTVDNSFVLNTEAFGNLGNYDILSGWNNQEGLFYTVFLQETSLQMTGKNISEGASTDALKAAINRLPLYNYPQNSLLKDLVVDYYINYYMSKPFGLASEGRSMDDRRVEVYSQISGELVLILPTIQHLQLHSATNTSARTYAYEFSYKSRDDAFWWYNGPDWLRYGADHANELGYVFGLPLSLNGDYMYTQEEKQLSKDMMKMWAEFAKYGNPGAEFEEFVYPRNQTYTVLNIGGFEKKTYPLNDVQRIWSAMDASILQLDYPDIVPEEVNVTAVCGGQKDQYLSGQLLLTQEEASKVMTTLLVVCIVLGIATIISVVSAVVTRVKYVRQRKRQQRELLADEVEMTLRTN